MTRFAGPHHVVEGAQRLVNRRLGVGVVDLVEVDVVGAEAAQRALDGVEDVLAGCAAVPGAGAHGARALGGDHEVVAPASETIAGPAISVNEERITRTTDIVARRRYGFR